jgi:signal peptidase I
MITHKKKETRPSVFREYAEAVTIALMLALLIKAFIFPSFMVPTGSMIPTILEGDQFFVNKFVFGTRVPFSDVKVLAVREPRRGDVVVFEYPNDRRIPYIKRVIGLPGDTVEIRDKRVYINGEEYVVKSEIHTDPYIVPERDNFGPITVPPDSYFMMGDNRDTSLDSRFWGFVHTRELTGTAQLIYWSWDIEAGGYLARFATIRWDRIGTIINR